LDRFPMKDASTRTIYPERPDSPRETSDPTHAARRRLLSAQPPRQAVRSLVPVDVHER
jgi:hypothetical protein